MRTRTNDTRKTQSERSSVGLLSSMLGLIGCAYVMGTPEYSGALPPTVERALTNLRKDLDRAGQDTKGMVAGLYYSVSGLVSGR